MKRKQKEFRINVSFDAVIGIFHPCPNCQMILTIIERDPLEFLIAREDICIDCPNCGDEVTMVLGWNPIDPKKIATAVEKRAKEMKKAFIEAKEAMQ